MGAPAIVQKLTSLPFQVSVGRRERGREERARASFFSLLSLSRPRAPLSLTIPLSLPLSLSVLQAPRLLHRRPALRRGGNHGLCDWPAAGEMMWWRRERENREREKEKRNALLFSPSINPPSHFFSPPSHPQPEGETNALKFSQVFHLAPVAGSFVVTNDLFRLNYA